MFGNKRIDWDLLVLLQVILFHQQLCLAILQRFQLVLHCRVLFGALVQLLPTVVDSLQFVRDLLQTFLYVNISINV